MQFLPFELPHNDPYHSDAASLAEELRRFHAFGTTTRTAEIAWTAGETTRSTTAFVNEFWTAKQRAASRLHEVSYRACFKPQLPRFFIERLTRAGDTVYDPFMGRGTTPIEAALLGRRPIACDINPLSRVLTEPRLAPPRLEEVARRLGEIDFTAVSDAPDELLAFYHPTTLAELCALRAYLLQRERSNELDAADAWIRMVAVNRLTGHSPGFFSVYTLPPNQAVSVDAQRKINDKRNQTPTRRDVPALILRKTVSLLGQIGEATRADLARNRDRALLLTAPAAATPQITDSSVDLVVTSPPFLDVVQYSQDNWLRCWFCGIDATAVGIPIHRKLPEWRAAMGAVFEELARVLTPGGFVAFEVGEVRGGKVKLEETVLPCGLAAGLTPELVLINAQNFTKTANCWGIANNTLGTNTNRVVLFRKP